jgi:hypothetical protein
MPVQHPNVKNAFIVHEGRFFEHPPRIVLVIETDLHTNPEHPNYNAKALTELISAAQAYVIAQNRQVTDFKIVPIGDRM